MKTKEKKQIEEIKKNLEYAYKAYMQKQTLSRYVDICYYLERLRNRIIEQYCDDNRFNMLE